MAAFPYPNKISQQSTKTSDQKFLISAYGDGYEQRAAVGINSKFDTWDLQLNMLTLAERNTFITSWNAHGRVIAWDWTPINGTAGKYIFNTTLTESNTGERYSFSFQARRVS